MNNVVLYALGLVCHGFVFGWFTLVVIWLEKAEGCACVLVFYGFIYVSTWSVINVLFSLSEAKG